MKQRIICNTLVVATIVLFICVGVQPTFAVNTNSTDKEEDCDIKSLDGTFEIISFIRGYCKSLNWGGFLTIGSVEIHGDDNQKPIITALTINPLKLIYHTEATHIYASRFIGSYYSVSANHDCVYGIAFGNIEWS